MAGDESRLEEDQTRAGGLLKMDIRQDSAAWQAGYVAGLAGQAPPTPPDVDDGLSFQAGVIEGLAARQRLESEK
jgi:hypothetical protein